nr:helix-turn-helix domain-containing protein [Aurantiacibacter xanthus]
MTDEYRGGRPRTVSDEQVAKVIERTLNTTPRDATHWSIRSMAAASGPSHTTIRRIWNALGLQPHRSETFKLSMDPLFVDKVQDIVGLYMSPANRAVVLCVDEKSQIQALDREQPVLPWHRACPNGEPIPISAVARHPCLPRSISPPVRISENAASTTGPPSFSTS